MSDLLIVIIFWGIVAYFAVFFVGFSVIILVNTFRPQMQDTNLVCEQEPEKQIILDSVEDSEGDGAFLFQEPMFPPEFDSDEVRAMKLAYNDKLRRERTNWRQIN
jgi:hypothetical protein